MANKSIDLFHKQILPHASGCAVPVMNNNIITVIQNVCEVSRIWRYRGVLTLVDGETPIVTPTDSVLVEIDNISFDSVPVPTIAYGDLDTEHPGWEDYSGSSTPRFVTQENLNSLLFIPYVEGDAVVNMYLKPSDDAIEVPDWFVDQYSKMISYGVLAKVLLIPDQKFTNPAMAGFFNTEYTDMLNDMKDINIVGQQRASKRTKPQFF
jgi:hypothetical protein